MQLLPFKDYSNPGTVNMGNPDLKPEFINNLEFSYSKADNKGNNFILSAYYAQTENLTQRIPRPITGTATDTALGLTSDIGKLLSQPINIASGTTYGLEGTGHIQILPIWDATLNVNFFQNQLVIGNIDTSIKKYLTDNSGNSWFAKINTNIKLPKNFSFQVNANYESPKVIAQGSLKETYWVDVALRKNLWKNKATIIVNCSDVFNTHQLITNYNQIYYAETITRVRETRVGNITFTYRFGKSDFGKPEQPKVMSNGAPKKKDKDGKEVKERENLKTDEGGGGEGGSPNGGQGGGAPAAPQPAGSSN
jgi:outer membrane receptor protein involved in Fe transport